MKIRLAGTADDSVVDGEGVRFVIFAQGCPRRCRNCQNAHAQPFDGGYETDTASVLDKIKQNPLLTGITLSGGEPFCQAEPMCELAKAAHDLGLDVWAYTGYTWEELTGLADFTDGQKSAVLALLNEVDVLVDGEYLETERDLALPFRGSRNQRLIDMVATRHNGQIVLYEPDNDEI